ncbi:amidohydrolase family protein [Agriterribacter sp.]|uniref:amidohydrolase family protein n=1 Tax=Agriterribacter sp. TaxID=2821509 RepID=UPI002C76371C|nr:amidohydrolase family protein [Agriterribacter sp.]HRO46714.1 amidohydrolase family protein [Agriterribacter sp.]HRQ18902.1 amidohydrolase family protein [Agriterribacter sp.]
MFIRQTFAYYAFVLVLLSCNGVSQDSNVPQRQSVTEVNAKEIAVGKSTIAITGATVIDGNGGPPLSNGCVLIRGNIIEAVGIIDAVTIPKDAERVDASGLTLMPGLMDAHFHLDRIKGLPALFLQHGVTSVRDPGAWIEAYENERKPGKAAPRLFLCGPHLDMPPPAYPYDAYIVRDSIEAVYAVNKQIQEGAAAIKVYFRMPPDLIRIVCNTAREKGIPVTAHLEITEAMEAIEAGLDGVEHITSFGLTLIPRREAEKYRQSVLSGNDFRKHGRYELWAKIDMQGNKVDSLAKFLMKKGTFVTPTLGPFEYRPEKNDHDTAKLSGFTNMKVLTARLQKLGVRMVLGSHSMIPYAEEGWAYQREMELWVESGVDPSDVIVASTMQNARYFRVDDRLGSIEKGKIADLILIKGNPLQDISTMRNIEKVMLNGVWVHPGRK